MPAPTADATNAYCDMTDADTYFTGQLYTTTWDAATDDNKNIALIMATTQLDISIEWDGDPTTEGQDLQWPRTGMLYPTGGEIPDDEIPTLLANQTAELAQAILAGNRTGDSDTAGIHSMKVASLEFVFKDGGPPSKPIPDNVLRALAIWGVSKFPAGSTGGVVNLVRV